MRISTKYFYTHHRQMFVKAAVVYDALAINKQVMSQRRQTASPRFDDWSVTHAAGPCEEDA